MSWESWLWSSSVFHLVHLHLICTKTVHRSHLLVYLLCDHRRKQLLEDMYFYGVVRNISQKCGFFNPLKDISAWRTSTWLTGSIGLWDTAELQLSAAWTPPSPDEILWGLYFQCSCNLVKARDSHSQYAKVKHSSFVQHKVDDFETVKSRDLPEILHDSLENMVLLNIQFSNTRIRLRCIT